jgi:hypothetical protein
MQGAIIACALALTIGQAKATTYDFNGSYTGGDLVVVNVDLRGATFAGNIGLGDNGLLLFANLNLNSTSGRSLEFLDGRPPSQCGPLDPTCGLPPYEYYLEPYSVTETYDASTQNYSFSFTGDPQVAIGLSFNLDSGVVSLGLRDECEPYFPDYAGGCQVGFLGSIRAETPLPGAAWLFASAMALLLFNRRQRGDTRE